MDAFRLALADDVAVLVRLHDRELDAATIAALHDDGFPATLALLPAGDAGEAALARMRGAVAGLSADPAHIDRLAADFAAIYLTGACGASPYESVWLHDEHLACQQPMFELREIYAAAGLRVDDWRKRYDDHLVLQLQYLAQRLRSPQEDSTLATLGSFLDEHLGFWFPDFAGRVVARCDSDFYAALAALTAAWLERLRAVIEEVSGQSRPPRAMLEKTIKAKFAAETASVAPLKFVPGGGAGC